MTPAMRRLLRDGKKRSRPNKNAQREECRMIAEALRQGVPLGEIKLAAEPAARSWHRSDLDM